jgi:hypothetical protein
MLKSRPPAFGEGVANGDKTQLARRPGYGVFDVPETERVGFFLVVELGQLIIEHRIGRVNAIPGTPAQGIGWGITPLIPF